MEEKEQAMLMTSKTIRGCRIFNRPRNDVFVESDTAQTLGATVNMSPINNRDVVICFSSPQDHCLTRGYMKVSQDGTCSTLNSMHGNDVHVVCVPINSMIIGKDGGNGDRQTFGIGEDGDPSPTLQTAHHHAVAITKTRKKAFGIDQQGGKGGASYTEDVAPTILSDSHGTPHGVCLVEGT